MDNQHKIKKIGGSNYLRVPKGFIDVYKLKDYIYYFEVSPDGKTITYKRMRKRDELITEEEQ